MSSPDRRLLVATGEYLRDNHPQLFRDEKLRKHFHQAMFHGFDFDPTMLRIGSMNMTLHGVDNPDISYRDSLAQEHDRDAGRYSLILANPPFAGSLDYDATAKDLQQIVKTKKTELLFLALFLRLLKTGGRAAVVVPDGVLFGSSKAHQELRKLLVEKHKLEGVLKLPSGVFRPYAGVSTAILLFTKTGVGGTDHVWFYDMQADGYSLDDKRNALLPDEKLGVQYTSQLSPEEHEKNTPRDEIDRDTYSLFELERGVPTDAYDLDEAVADGFLVPPSAVSVPLKFVRQGIRYDELSDEDKEKWDMLEWEEKLPKGDIDANAVNKWLFNEDTVDKVLKHLMTHGLKVAEGDRLGKTIVFAKNHDHAMFIAKRFDANYPHLAGQFARVIDFKIEYPQSLIDDFSIPEKDPHIAISVDMLDTGIDVPEVVNLVFFKIVRSKTKFWQMIGRGTRLRPNLFGPGRHKDEFRIFDFCQNFEFFNQNPNVTDGALGMSLGQRLFSARIQLVGILQDLPEGELSDGLFQLDRDVRTRLFDEVSGMTLDNFLVRAKRKAVEQFQQAAAWDHLSGEDRDMLMHEVAGLPSALEDNDITAKQFDYIILSGQLALLQNQVSFAQCKEKVMAIAARLEELGNVPMVAAQMPLILEVQSDEYWQDIDAWALEQMRRRLRALIKLIEGDERIIVYTDFEDEIGVGTTIDLPDAGVGTDKARFQMKVRHFLKQHADHITIQKLRRNEQLTPQDLSELERILIAETGVSNSELIEAYNLGGLGLFVRSLVGLERDAAKDAFAEFMAGQNLNGNQIEFINLIVDHLTERGAMDPRRLYESPFTDFDDQGVSGVFRQADVQRIMLVLNNVRERAGLESKTANG